MFPKCFQKVSRKLSKCFKKVSCCIALIAASRAEGFMEEEISRIFQGCFMIKSFSRVFQGSFKKTFKLFQKSVMLVLIAASRAEGGLVSICLFFPVVYQISNGIFYLLISHLSITAINMMGAVDPDV